MKISKNLLLFGVVMLFTTCNKRPFAHIEIVGQIVSKYTGLPLQAGLELWVGGEYPGSKGTTKFGSVRTKGDGTFDIKSKAQWSGNNYNVLVLPDSLTGGREGVIKVQVARGKKVDVGVRPF